MKEVFGYEGEDWIDEVNPWEGSSSNRKEEFILFLKTIKEEDYDTWSWAIGFGFKCERNSF